MKTSKDRILDVLLDAPPVGLTVREITARLARERSMHDDTCYRILAECRVNGQVKSERRRDGVTRYRLAARTKASVVANLDWATRLLAEKRIPTYERFVRDV